MSRGHSYRGVAEDKVVGSEREWPLRVLAQWFCWCRKVEFIFIFAVSDDRAHHRTSESQNLTFSFFFTRIHRERSDTTKFFLTFAYQLATAFPSVK